MKDSGPYPLEFSRNINGSLNRPHKVEILGPLAVERDLELIAEVVDSRSQLDLGIADHEPRPVPDLVGVVHDSLI